MVNPRIFTFFLYSKLHFIIFLYVIIVDMTEISLVVYKTTFKQQVNTAYPFSRIRLLPHSSLGLSKASFSNYLVP